MEDAAAELTPDVGHAPDRDHMFVLDRNFDITSFVPHVDGTAEIFVTNFAGSGPVPFEGAPAFVDGCKREPDPSGAVNTTLALYRVFYDWSDERELFVGMVNPSLPTHWGGLSTNDTDAVWVKMNDSTFTVSTWYNRGAATLGHEAGHDGGLKHVPCADGNGDGIPDELKGGAVDLSHQAALDFPDCHLAEIEPEGFYGFDVYWNLFGVTGPTVISNDPDEAAPNRAFPLLSYSSPTWIDPYHYCRLLTYYGVSCSPDAAGIKWNAPDAPSGGPLAIPPEPVPAPPDGTQFLVVSGSLGAEPGADVLEPLGAFESRPNRSSSVSAARLPCQWQSGLANSWCATLAGPFSSECQFRTRSRSTATRRPATRRPATSCFSSRSHRTPRPLSSSRRTASFDCGP